MSQVLSYYNYVISNKRRIENRFSGNRYDIKEYIDSSDFVTNIQTKFLAGVNFENRADLPDADCYEKARTHLKKFKFIGAQEKFSDSIGRIAEELNWKHVKLKSRNASLKSIAELEGDVIEIVREKCKYDIALYEEFASDICTGDYCAGKTFLSDLHSGGRSCHLSAGGNRRHEQPGWESHFCCRSFLPRLRRILLHCQASFPQLSRSSGQTRCISRSRKKRL